MPKKKSADPSRRRGPKAMSDNMLDAVARRFRALGVPSRLRVLNALMGGPRSMSELVELTGLAQSNLSRQVTELEVAGCVARRRNGRSVTVEIADPSLLELCDLVCSSVRDQARTAHAAVRAG